MVIGNLTCSPNCSFRLMRSYITQVSFSGILGLPIITDNVFFFPANMFTLFDYVCIFNPKFFAWNAGAWLLDAIVDEYYYQPSGGGIKTPVDFSLTYIKHSDDDLPSVLNVPFSVSTPPNTFALPPADQDYWWNGTEP